MATFETLAAKCAAGVALDLLVAIASVESGIQPLAVRDGVTLTQVGSVGEGMALAVGAADQGREPRVGLMGLTERQLRAAGLSLADGFDTCSSLSVAATIITAAPKQNSEPADRAAVRSWWRPGGQFASVSALETAIAHERTNAPGLAKREIAAASLPKAPAAAAPSDASVAEGPLRVPVRRAPSVEPGCWDIFARQRAGLAQCEDPAVAGTTELRVRIHQPETASVVIFGSAVAPR